MGISLQRLRVEQLTEMCVLSLPSTYSLLFVLDHYIEIFNPRHQLPLPMQQTDQAHAELSG